MPFLESEEQLSRRVRNCSGAEAEKKAGGGREGEEGGDDDDVVEKVSEVGDCGGDVSEESSPPEPEASVVPFARLAMARSPNQTPCRSRVISRVS
jgi:hypothetical protein